MVSFRALKTYLHDTYKAVLITYMPTSHDRMSSRHRPEPENPFPSGPDPVTHIPHHSNKPSDPHIDLTHPSPHPSPPPPSDSYSWLSPPSPRPLSHPQPSPAPSYSPAAASQTQSRQQPSDQGVWSHSRPRWQPWPPSASRTLGARSPTSSANQPPISQRPSRWVLATRARLQSTGKHTLTYPVRRSRFMCRFLMSP